MHGQQGDEGEKGQQDDLARAGQAQMLVQLYVEQDRTALADGPHGLRRNLGRRRRVTIAGVPQTIGLRAGVCASTAA